MHHITAQNVCHALPAGLSLLRAHGEWEDSRAGRVLVAPAPVETTYLQPMERVLLCPARDANPFFHLAEAMWMLAGRQDARWLDQFVKDYSSRFAEDDGHQHGAYGHRWRNHWGPEDEVPPLDQVQQVVRILREDPTTRRAVLSMWDPLADLGTQHRDIPCNTTVMFRIRHARLDMMVTCRSNDVIWGAYGANAVHFAFLLEYVAAMVGVASGCYTQVSFNYHAYEATLQRLLEQHQRLGTPLGAPVDLYPDVDVCRLVDDPNTFDAELAEVLEGWNGLSLRNTFLERVVVPMLAANELRRMGDMPGALWAAGKIIAGDWRTACTQWIERRTRR